MLATASQPVALMENLIDETEKTQSPQLYIIETRRYLDQNEVEENRIRIITDNMKYNEQGNQLWIYQARPLIYPGQFILGAFKAVYIKYFIPLYCGIGLLLLCLGGIRLLDDIVFIFTLITLITLGTTLGIFPFFPFAQERNSFGKGKILLYSFLATLLSFAFIFLHWGLQNLSLIHI